MVRHGPPPFPCAKSGCSGKCGTTSGGMRSGWLQVRQVEDLQAEVLEVAVAAGLLDGLYDVEVVVDDGHAGKVLAHPLAVGVGHVHEMHSMCRRFSE